MLTWKVRSYLLALRWKVLPTLPEEEAPHHSYPAVKMASYVNDWPGKPAPPELYCYEHCGSNQAVSDSISVILYNMNLITGTIVEPKTHGYTGWAMEESLPLLFC